MTEKELRNLLAQHGFSIANMAYRVIEDGQVFEYRMVIRTTDPANTLRLADELRQLDLMHEVRISPTGDYPGGCHGWPSYPNPPCANIGQSVIEDGGRRDGV